MNKKALLDRQKRIRNFSIIAHIDHGKSTIADRILELTNSLDPRNMKEQMLDSMELERERGITIKLNAIEVLYNANDGNQYILHLIDTPGHVDFTYEVSRSLAACEGALLVVDASQGVQAQTLANAYLAIDNNLEIIPVINKIDLPNADVEHTKIEIEEIIGLSANDAIFVSAKSGIGIKDILESIVTKIPEPQGDPDAPLQALIFDSYYDQYRGIVPTVRVFNGTIKRGDKIWMMSTNAKFEVVEVGVYTPNEVRRDYLGPGDVGYLTATIKDIDKVRVGDTITNLDYSAKSALPGYRKLNPMVYCGLFPVDNADYDELKEALEKLTLNDSSLIYEPETSQALGFGFRVGFLGLLHMDIVQERLEREFDVNLIATAPSVNYKVNLENGNAIYIDNPALLPDSQFIKNIEEPYVKTDIMTPSEYIGPIMEICYKRAIYKNLHYIDQTRVTLEYEMPLSEIIFDFFDRLKSSTKGYASFDYRFSSYQVSNLVKLDILINGEKVDALSTIVHKDSAYRRGHLITVKLKKL
ncbi:MAG: translation elongation factor 4, partial [Bacilli bacterium]|nr:translation elongation factor 4 [Bacilli bacterium]